MSARGKPGSCIFVTGTDTGVGKTLLALLMLAHLRSAGRLVVGMKPFASGCRRDARLLQSVGAVRMPLEDINPFFLPWPVAPWVGFTRLKHTRAPSLSAIVSRIERMRCACEYLIVEGVGGVMVPLTSSVMLVDLIVALRCPVVVIARNRLGTINHTLLTVDALRARGIRRLKVVMMGAPGVEDLSCVSNPPMIRRWCGVRVVTVPWLGPYACTKTRLGVHARRLKILLAEIVNPRSF